MNSTATSFWPLGIFFGLTVVTIVSMIALSYIIGERHRGRVTDEPYESGMPLTGSAQVNVPVKYYLVAVFFVVFDVEALFIYTWAVAARELGWPGYAEAATFITILLAALVYLARQGALDWGPLREGGRREPPGPEGQ